jgi:hypothetical protein
MERQSVTAISEVANYLHVGAQALKMRWRLAEMIAHPWFHIKH